MGQNPMTFLDGSKQDRENAMREFFGLSPEQSFQEIEVKEDRIDIKRKSD